ncbi:MULTISPECIES: hypothetical protein [unclassified Desulfovibrio]|uniref:hypothetical protein n=1 Tax=unclassified Desulfovibrio TaxID=2593640 RepID=UPI000F5E5233|nr:MULTISPECIES: hypothetical protein [unclassified Desulfovibrio]RRD69185.1 hypothetical protein EII24_11095 [Desulfovibrio sp. OH1209_COT-279]RRD85669.1 hypothetical protein EII23_11095 [Desulfovibrio sp. OH1186_COT-070]
MNSLDQTFLDKVFPTERTDAFFDALFGGAEEGAYDIRLVCRHVSPREARLDFELRQRPGKCLACNLTYGLPQVFARHPVLNVAGIVREVAAKLGWEADKTTWRLGRTEEQTQEVHLLPLFLEQA